MNFQIGGTFIGVVPPARCPQPQGPWRHECGVLAGTSTRLPCPVEKNLPALGRSVNPSKPTNPTSRPRREGRQTGPLPFSLARAWTVGKPFKAYKPHQTAQPTGLRIGLSFFTGSRFVGKKPLKTHQTLQTAPFGWHTDTVIIYSHLAQAIGQHRIHAQTHPRKNLSGSLPPAQ